MPTVYKTKFTHQRTQIHAYVNYCTTSRSTIIQEHRTHRRARGERLHDQLPVHSDTSRVTGATGSPLSRTPTLPRSGPSEWPVGQQAVPTNTGGRRCHAETKETTGNPAHTRVPSSFCVAGQSWHRCLRFFQAGDFCFASRRYRPSRQLGVQLWPDVYTPLSLPPPVPCASPLTHVEQQQL